MTRVAWTSTMIGTLSLTAILAGGARQAGSSTAQKEQSTPSTPARLAEMRHHFAQVLLVHEAVIRGDLPAVRVPATEIATLVMPAALPAKAGPFVIALRQAGQDAVEAKTLFAAATATVAMVVQCANCHVAVDVFPAPSRRPTHDVGATVGHMMEHQLAVDDMLAGLLVPSSSQWLDGAGRLRVAALRAGELPKDPEFTKWVREADVEVHRLAEEAILADTTEQRASVYVGLIVSCARCHGLHSKIWGPGRGGRQP
jgi:hypothetical protein